MKKVIYVVMLLAFSACGLQSQIDDAKKDIQNLEDKNKSIEARIAALEAQNEANIYTMTSLQDQISQLGLDLMNTDADNTAVTNNIQTQITNLQAINSALQAQVVAAQTAIVALQNQDTVLEYKDPCGAGPGFNEVLMRTKSGKWVAFFESGSNRFLTVLTPGNYRTTDQSACYFTLTSAGAITNEHY